MRSLITKLPVIHFIVVVGIAFAFNGAISLWDQDESAYAGFARTMIETGDWLIPDFMWSDVHRKPPLHFWNIALAFKVFGPNEFAVRFSSTLLILLTYALVYIIGHPIWGKRDTAIGMMVLSTSLLVPTLGKVAVTDATLLFFSTLSALSAIRIMMDKSYQWILLFWLGVAGALLTKGPPIILFMGSFGLLTLIVYPNRWRILRLHPWFFLPIALLPLLYWGYLTTQQDGGAFLEWMLDWYVFKRVGGSVFGQTGPPGTHIVGIFLFFLPYLTFAPRAFVQVIRTIIKPKDDSSHLLAIWFVAGWLIYEFSPSKLPAYVIVAHVPFAIMIARALNEDKPAARWSKWLHLVLMLVVLAALMVAPIVLDLGAMQIIVFALGALPLIGLNIWWFISSTTAELRKRLLISNLTFQAIVWTLWLPQVDQLKDSTRDVSTFVEAHAPSQSRVLIGNAFGHPPSLPFYLGAQFDSIEEMQDTNELINAVAQHEPLVLVLDQDQREALDAAYENLNWTVISSFMTDRKGRADYHILIKD